MLFTDVSGNHFHLTSPLFIAILYLHKPPPGCSTMNPSQAGERGARLTA